MDDGGGLLSQAHAFNLAMVDFGRANEKSIRIGEMNSCADLTISKSDVPSRLLLQAPAASLLVCQFHSAPLTFFELSVVQQIQAPTLRLLDLLCYCSPLRNI